MRKFIVYTRFLPVQCKITESPLIVEVDGEMILAVEDPSVMWLPEGEFKFRILKPETLYEPKEISSAKEKIMVPPIYCSHVIFSTIREARAEAYALITHSFELALFKKNIIYTHEQVATRCNEIQEILLP